ncbi:MAG: hypothetical protein ABIQ41_07790 [Gemmatimonadales bacterium]
MRQVVRSLGVAVILAVVAAAPARAQLPQIGAPRGQLRIEIGGNFSVANRSLFNGSAPLHGEWDGEFGVDLDRNLFATESMVRTITGNGSYRLSGGRSSVTASTQKGTAIISAALGVTRRITLFGTLPFVRARAQTSLRLDSATANAGFNPADPAFGTPAGAVQTAAFFAQFQAALNTLSTNIGNGSYDSDPVQKALAIQTLADGNILQSQIGSLLLGTISPLVPLASSPEGVTILGLVDGLQGTLSGPLGVGGFTTDPALPGAKLTDSDFRSYLTKPAGDVQGFYRGDEILQRPGDIEMGMVYTIVDRPAFRVAATGLVRLPTGLLDRSEDFFDVGTGDGQTDLEGRIAADLTAGPIGARLSFGHNRQLARDLARRVNPLDQPIAYQFTLSTVSLDPGDETTLGIEPFLRFAPGFALAFGAFRWSHGADDMRFAGSGAPVAASAVAPSRSATALQAGMTYSSFAGIRGRGTPIEARWAYRSVVSASGGRVDKTRTLWFQMRAYYKLW